MLVKNFLDYTKILLLLSLLNSQGIINEETFLNILSEIYYQPYPEFSREALYFRFPNFDNFKKPTTTKIAIQVGHLVEEENLPPELLKISKIGAVVNGIKEVEINKNIAIKIKEKLEKEGYQVEILPAIIPPSYYADVFVAIHANSADKLTSGFMVSTPFKDYSEKAHILKRNIIREYKKATGMNFIAKVTQNMTHYYAFNWSKFKRSIHPKTPAVIIETGNMRNDDDLRILLENSDMVATGISNGIIKFLKEIENKQN
jgi:N-acetylmuramoyl-L-alanine amidase